MWVVVGFAGWIGRAGVAVTLLTLAPGVHAQELRSPNAREGTTERARSSAHVHSYVDHYLRLFQRAWWPGGRGELVVTEHSLPMYTYWGVSARGLNGALSSDSLSIELAGFGAYEFIAPVGESRWDGDITVAKVSQQLGGTTLALGRQAIAAGAARYSRLDGAHVELNPIHIDGPWWVSAGAYAGFSVLPRWNEQPSYVYLGAVSPDLLRDPSVLEPMARTRHTLAGGRVTLGHAQRFRTMVSYHGERAYGELSRRSLGLDVDMAVHQRVRVFGKSLLDIDSGRFPDARVVVDTQATDDISVSAEYFHAEPALLLSSQSVFSVFAQDAFDELGVEVAYQPMRHISMAGSGFVQLISATEAGGRGQLRLRVLADESSGTEMQIVYSRVAIPEGGYHGVRNSLRRRFGKAWNASVQAYHYYYDKPLLGYDSSSFYSASVGWDLARAWSLSWSGTLGSSPYASADAQTMLRVSYRYQGAL